MGLKDRVVEVEGRKVSVIDQLSFWIKFDFLVEKKYVPYGGEGGSAFSVDVSPNDTTDGLVYVFGSDTEEIT